MNKHELSKADLQPITSDNLTPRQVSVLLNIPEATLAVWRSTNRVVLPYFKLGHHVRYRRSDLDAFVQKNMRNAS
jgi:hypothetical protein